MSTITIRFIRSDGSEDSVQAATGSTATIATVPIRAAVLRPPDSGRTRHSPTAAAAATGAATAATGQRRPRTTVVTPAAATAPASRAIRRGACGSAGFLCEAFDYLKARPNLTTSDLETLQTKTFFGKEKKSLAYVIAIMNMILHGIEAPNIIHTNTLSENIADIQEKNRFDVVLANPPFGGKERKEVQQNFPIPTGETAFLFLQHFIKILRAGGRGAVVIKNTFLSNTDNASVSLRKLLLESCNLHTVLDMPSGTFQGAGVKTVVLFFDKGAPTRKVWFYQLNPGRNMGKTNPLNDEDLVDFIERQKTFADSAKSWSVDVAGIDAGTYELSVKNPKGGTVVTLRTLKDILDEIARMPSGGTADVLLANHALRRGYRATIFTYANACSGFFTYLDCSSDMTWACNVPSIGEIQTTVTTDGILCCPPGK